MNKRELRNETNKEFKVTDFDALRISVASPESILSWSYGEVTKPETINYRTQKPERDGLFDERIFGPIKDWECYCGKYKKIRYKGVICDKCGVEVTRSAVRRERMGHIDLSVPVTHIWYVRGVPSVLSMLLDLSVTDLEKIVYFAGFIVLEVNEEIRKSALEQLEKEFSDAKSKIKDNKMSEQDLAKVEGAYRITKQEILSLLPKKILTESQYQDLSLKYGRIIKVGIGAEAIYELLKKIDLDELSKQFTEELNSAIGLNRKKYLRRLKLVLDMKNANIKADWLILTKLPVIPPDLRPMVQLDGGRFAASDLNDLYRRVINRNNRLKKLISQGAPEVICRNEKRMLQEAIDSLIDNSARRGRAVSTGAAARKLRSLSDMLHGKQGRFRQNLLGKRVDYSGRSVIVVGPNLKLHQCGLPKAMALELFKPFVISKLINEGHVHNVKNATKLMEKGEPIVWDILEKITSGYHVLLNRAPTLHRLGVQGFQPVLIEGKAIQVHPLVCMAFNADFDGDQMAVHVPLSTQAKDEAAKLMRSANNILKPASGEPVIVPRMEIVSGCYWLTTFAEGARGEGKIFGSKNEAILAYQEGFVNPRAKVKVRMDGERVETSAGRILFNNILPEEMRFRNEVFDSKALKKILAEHFEKFAVKETAEFADRIKDIGFQYASISGMTISVSDIQTPKDKGKLVKEGDKALEEIENQYQRGLITESERKVKIIELWTQIRGRIENEMIENYDPKSPVYQMVKSGARGSFAQVTQLGGMKGLVVNPAGEIIELPVKANYKEGLPVFEYFISTHGARKGKSDTSLRTSEAGYLTRRLVDVAQDVVVSIEDCNTDHFLEIDRAESEEMGEKFTQRLIGRVAAADIKDQKTTIIKKGEIIHEKLAEQIEESKIQSVQVRTVFGCHAEKGICQACYGRDLASGKLVEISTVAGIMAAQAIGEPGTQLTMKTFHMGGVTGEDITSGLPRVEELFEARTPRNPAVISEIEGKVKIFEEKDMRKIIVTSPEVRQEVYELEKDYETTVKDGDIVKARQAIAVAPSKKAIRSLITGKVKIEKGKISILSTEKASVSYPVSTKTNLKVADGDTVTKGQELTEGHLPLDLLLKLRGRKVTERYIIRSVQEIYASQGQMINDKHIEIIVREMFSKLKIKDGGDSNMLAGQVIDHVDAMKINNELKKNKKKEMSFEESILGITRVSLITDSFLSAASFQETTGVLIDAAVRGAVDRLQGLKENVIIGKLIPAGTGFTRKIS
ncbi:MAG: DNA-directed RNA polymerase subunit beta' [Candidatus Berkelbacteria bacterium]|nr:DNA-directed RNA polymerase subunit beta' [Candidatus Berkelbacteria bacterium]